MQVLYERCAGLDVHQKSVVATILLTATTGHATKVTQTFGTMTVDLLALDSWLQEQQVSHVALESTGVYWFPVHNLLEEGRTLILVNPQHMKAVPGRKTDVKLRHEVASIAVEQEQSRLDLVYCHQSPTRPCEQSNPLV